MPRYLQPDYLKTMGRMFPNVPWPEPEKFMSPEEFSAQSRAASTIPEWNTLKRDWQGNPYRYENPQDWRRLQEEILYGNPIAALADTTTAGPRRGGLGRIKQAVQTVAGPLSYWIAI